MSSDPDLCELLLAFLDVDSLVSAKPTSRFHAALCRRVLTSDAYCSCSHRQRAMRARMWASEPVAVNLPRRRPRLKTRCCDAIWTVALSAEHVCCTGEDGTLMLSGQGIDDKEVCPATPWAGVVAGGAGQYACNRLPWPECHSRV